MEIIVGCFELWLQKSQGTMPELATKYEISVWDMAKNMHTLKLQYRSDHKNLTNSKESGTSPKKTGLATTI